MDSTLVQAHRPGYGKLFVISSSWVRLIRELLDTFQTLHMCSAPEIVPGVPCRQYAPDCLQELVEQELHADRSVPRENLRHKDLGKVNHCIRAWPGMTQKLDSLLCYSTGTNGTTQRQGGDSESVLQSLHA